MKNLYKTILLSSLLGALSSISYAQSVTNNFQASASLNSTCTVSSATLNFGGVTPDETGDATSNGTLSFICTKNTNVQLSVGLGASSQSTYASRKMTGANPENTNIVSYNIYTDSNYQNVLGDGIAAGTKTIEVVGTGQNQTLTLYGKIPLNQFVRADTYSDTLTATLSY